jgi:hypothetical protein
MSRSLAAYVGFGLLIPEEKFVAEEMEYLPGTKLIFSGISNGGTQAYLCAKNTVQEAYSFKGSMTKLQTELVIAGPYWQTFFQEIAAKHGIENPEIGWFLCVSET